MGTEGPDVQSTIARHEREIDELQEHVKALEGGYAKEQVEAELRRRMSELEVELKFQELQETIVEEEAEKNKPPKKHRFFPWR